MKGIKTGNARYYAYAMFELAHENHQEEEILEEFELMADLQKEIPHLKLFLELPLLPEKDKMQILDKVLKNNVSEIFLNFIKILVKKQQFDLFEMILRVYRHFCDERGERIRVTVTTTVPLDEKQENHLSSILSRYFKKPAVIRNTLDCQVIGGLLLQAGDLWMDASLKGKTDKLHKKLGEAAKKILQSITIQDSKDLD